MGWWSVPEIDDDSFVVGDDVFTAMDDFCQQVNAEYNGAFERSPTIEEYHYILEQALCSETARNYIGDLTSRQIKKLDIKTGVTKRRRYTLKVGDIFSFKLAGTDYFCFGRIIHSLKTQHDSMELFDYFSKQPIFDHSVTKWITLPLLTGVTFIFQDPNYTKGDWQIVGHTPNFMPDERYQGIYFSMGVLGFGETKYVDLFDKGYKVLPQAPVCEIRECTIPVF